MFSVSNGHLSFLKLQDRYETGINNITSQLHQANQKLEKLESSHALKTDKLARLRYHKGDKFLLYKNLI